MLPIFAMQIMSDEIVLIAEAMFDSSHSSRGTQYLYHPSIDLNGEESFRNECSNSSHLIFHARTLATKATELIF